MQLKLNVETSVVGFVTAEVQQGGGAVKGMELASSDQIKGSSVLAVASWSDGQLSSLYKLAGGAIDSDSGGHERREAAVFSRAWMCGSRGRICQPSRLSQATNVDNLRQLR